MKFLALYLSTGNVTELPGADKELQYLHYCITLQKPIPIIYIIVKIFDAF